MRATQQARLSAHGNMGNAPRQSRQSACSSIRQASSQAGHLPSASGKQDRRQSAGQRVHALVCTECKASLRTQCVGVRIQPTTWQLHDNTVRRPFRPVLKGSQRHVHNGMLALRFSCLNGWPSSPLQQQRVCVCVGRVAGTCVWSETRCQLTQLTQ